MVLFTMQAYAQTSRTRTKKGYISVSAALVFPAGDFANNNVKNDKAGLALFGLQANVIDVGYLFSKNFGISGHLSGAYVFLYRTEEAGISSFDVPNYWIYRLLMAGPLLSFPSATGGAAFDVRVLAGSIKVLPPGPQTDSKFHDEALVGSGAVFDIGVGIRFHLNRVISFTIALDYIISSNLEFDFSRPRYESGYEQRITAVNFLRGSLLD